MPIAGDTTKLPYADGLTQLQQRMAHNMNFLCRNQPGGQQLRQQMGHAQFGARVVYGDCLFYTFSPNEQHSAWVLRLSRYRENDPCLQGDSEQQESIRKCAGRLTPNLAARDSTSIEFPAYKFRRIMTVRDPMAVMDAYALHIKLRLPRLFGQRSCPMCPRCNNRGSIFPCQNRFGSVMRATGGPFGGSPAYGAATEHQGVGTPHVHGEIHLCTVYQYKLLTEIADLIERDLLSPESIMEFNEWFHRQHPPDEALHQELLPQVETEWRGRFSDPKHNDMSQVPEYIAHDTSANMWSDKNMTQEMALAEGKTFKQNPCRWNLNDLWNTIVVLSASIIDDSGCRFKPINFDNHACLTN